MISRLNSGIHPPVSQTVSQRFDAATSEHCGHLATSLLARKLVHQLLWIVDFRLDAERGIQQVQPRDRNAYSCEAQQPEEDPVSQELIANDLGHNSLP